VPRTPYRRVEYWPKGRDHAGWRAACLPACPKVDTNKGGTFCGGEKLWDSAFSLLKTGADKGAYGMAINPSSKRSRHQVPQPAGTAGQRVAALKARRLSGLITLAVPVRRPQGIPSLP
jgi:hypothetical protein